MKKIIAATVGLLFASTGGRSPPCLARFTPSPKHVVAAAAAKALA